MKLEIQRMQERHVSQCVHLYMAAFSREPWNEHYDGEAEVRNYFINCFQYDSFLGFTVFSGTKIVALCTGMKKPWIKGIEYYIDQFCVSPDLQGRGIGSWFLKEIEALLSLDNIKGVLLNTEKSYPSYRFYQKNGFHELQGLVLLGKG